MKPRSTGNDLTATLRHTFGFDSFRPHQREIVEATLAGRDVFATLPTGGGKSLCYQLPAVVGEGLTVVVSPLIALMEDQVMGALSTGLRAASLTSATESEAARETWRALARGELDLLYVSPERLAGEEFRARLVEWGVRRFAVDEAHCISEWGHEFRPEYRMLRTLRAEFPTVPVAAFTATATAAVQRDIVSQLALRDPLMVRASFDRPEILYRVERRSDAVGRLLAFLETHDGEAGIVYRGSRKGCEETAAALTAAGVRAMPYHAGLSDELRTRTQRAFVHDEIQVIVATIAFGMGIDKSNVRWIVHDDLPRSLEAYYQETGRAGRDGENAEVLLLWGAGDIQRQRYWINQISSDAERAAAERRLSEVLGWADGSGCRRQRLLAHFDERHPGNCGRCDVCLGEVAMVDATVAARKLLSAMVRTGERFGAHHLISILLGEPTERIEELGHDQLPTFGVGAELDRAAWLDLTRELEAGSYIARAEVAGGERMGGYFLTSSGRLLLAGKESFQTRVRERPARGRSRRGRRTPSLAPGTRSPARADAAPLAGKTSTARGAVAPLTLRADQQRILDELKKWRTATARERGVPPYIIANDRTLASVATNRPTTRTALLRCHGVGDAKLAQYGEQMLAVVRRVLEG